MSWRAHSSWTNCWTWRRTLAGSTSTGAGVLGLAKARTVFTMPSRRLISPSMVRASSMARLSAGNRRCWMKRRALMAVSGFLTSWARPAAKMPRDASLSLRRAMSSLATNLRRNVCTRPRQTMTARAVASPAASQKVTAAIVTSLENRARAAARLSESRSCLSSTIRRRSDAMSEAKSPSASKAFPSSSREAPDLSLSYAASEAAIYATRLVCNEPNALRSGGNAASRCW